MLTNEMVSEVAEVTANSLITLLSFQIYAPEKAKVENTCA